MNFNFKKRLGQNFLIDNQILQKIVNSVEPTDQDLILEIGAGSGNLTKELQRYNCQIIAYEIDEETKQHLDQIANNKTAIIYDDFLKRDVIKDLKTISYNNLYIIANLPYYITTPIIEKIIKDKITPYKMILMVQKEVADRLTAQPKTSAYGFITVYLNHYFTISKLFNVSRKAFKPSPNVDSSVLEFTSHYIYEKVDDQKFTQLIKDAFKYKRKNLNNNFHSYNKELIATILAKHNLSLNSRAEELSIDIFIEITNAL